MQVKDSYDLVVIGDQLGGLFLAAGAAQRGKKVLVLEESSVPAVSYEIPSGRFLGDFTAEPWIGLEKGSGIDRFFTNLGLYHDLNDLFIPHEPSLQVVEPKLRFDHPYDRELLRQELSRECPDVAEALAALLSGAIQNGGPFSSAVAAAGLPVEYERFGRMQPLLFGSMARHDLPYPAYKKVISMAERSVRFPFGGKSALKERLLSRIMVFGGNMKRATRVEEIVFERGRLAGVLLSSFEGFVRCSMVAGAMWSRTFLDLIPEEFRPAKLESAVSRLDPKFWRLSFTLLIPDKVIPEGMGTHLILDKEEEFIQIQMFPKDIYGGIPARHKAIVVRSLVPYEPESLREEYISRHMKRCLAKVKTVIPFLDSEKFHISPDPSNLAKDPAFQRYYRFPALEYIPPAFLAYEKGLSDSLSQTEFLDWSRFGLPGLALCSRDIYPLFGATGEVMAAMDLLAVMGKAGGRA